jgi:hypothetical protein
MLVSIISAIGRVIRNKNDYGAVLLLDSRFTLYGNQQGLSKWLRPHIQKDEGIGRAISSLVKFYKSAESNVRSRRQVQPRPAHPGRAPNDVKMILRYEEEGKENKYNISDEDEVTKVAVIRKGETSKDGEKSQVSTAIAEEGASNYVPPERIIARLDMKALGSQQLSNLMHGKKQHSFKKKCDVTRSLLPSSLAGPRLSGKRNIQVSCESTVEINFGKVSSTHPNRKKKVAKTPAKEFFIQVQSRMSTAEFSTIKKSIVTMKQYLQQEHRKCFLTAARDIIDIILQYESFENRSKSNKPELLSLLFKVLPKHYILDCQRWTLYSVLQQSKFEEVLKDSLAESDHKKSISYFSNFLQILWYGEDARGEIATGKFLQKLQEIVIPLEKADNRFRLQHLRFFFKLIPLEYQAPADALIEDFKASKKIQRLKEKEKSSSGENIVKSKPFRSLSVASTTFPVKKELINEYERESSRPIRIDKRKLSFQAQIPQKRVNHNPYQRKASDEKKKLKQSVDRLFARRESANPFEKAINQSESDTFTGKVVTTNGIKSNAPKNLSCGMCHKTSEKVHYHV